MQLFYRKYGSGENLVILHGLFGSSDNWNTLAKKFADHFRVFSVDQRNHGQSFHHKTFNYDVMSEDLERLLKHLGINKMSLMGHSMGGKTAMKFALNHRDYIDKLVIVDIAPRFYPVHHDHIIDALCELNIENMTRREEADEALSDSITHKAVRLFLLKNLDRNEEGRLEWKINLPVIKKNLDKVGEEIKSEDPINVPVLFIAGELSNYVLPSDESNIKTLFPAAEIIYLENTGHWIHAEAPDLFYKKVSQFLNR